MTSRHKYWGARKVKTVYAGAAPNKGDYKGIPRLKAWPNSPASNRSTADSLRSNSAPKPTIPKPPWEIEE